MKIEGHSNRFTAALFAGAVIATSCLLLTAGGADAQAIERQPADGVTLPPDVQVGDYIGKDLMIPMRDGKYLHAEVWRPKGATRPLPVLIQRSPYGFALKHVSGLFGAELKALAADKFIFVLEDIRGRFGSEGDFVMLRHTAPKDAVDESTDTYDTIDWLTKNLADNNGKVGVFGISYAGWTTAMATVKAHPALKAVSIQASPEDMFVGDDFHHNGAFRLDYAWSYSASLETDGRTMKAFKFADDDAYTWYLKQGPLAGLDQRALGSTLPSWENFVDHPNFDPFWAVGVTSDQMPAKPAIPDLIVAGWWDQEDFYGPLTIYRKQHRNDADGKTFLVIGPWNHGGWSRSLGAKYGPLDFGSETSRFFQEQVEVPWFRYWLKGEGRLDQPGALVFETGSNEWRHYTAWPPADGITRRSLYLHAGGKLSFDPPTANDAAPDKFVSDPANPVPYRTRPIKPMQGAGSTWTTWLADDQAPLAKRPDVLTWQTEPLARDVTLRGEAITKLFASTSGSDADWIVKLIDVFPPDEATPADLRGRQVIIADEVFRGRYRESFERPKPLTPGEVLDYTIDLHTASHVFKPGHRIAVQVQSTWFPLIDRNPQTFEPSIYKAGKEAFKAQTHTVYHSLDHPSAIAVDVAGLP